MECTITISTRLLLFVFPEGLSQDFSLLFIGHINVTILTRDLSCTFIAVKCSRVALKGLCTQNVHASCVQNFAEGTSSCAVQSSFDPKYVRRRMKLVLAQQHRILRMRMVSLGNFVLKGPKIEQQESHEVEGLAQFAAPIRPILCVQLAWGLLCIPLVPLLATPVPNLPLYFAGYKVCTSLF